MSAAPGHVEKADRLLTKVAHIIDKGYRWYWESDEPDATGRWRPEHRRKMLKYIHNRDGGRCGLCAGEMKLKGAQIEHIVPKVFARFDVRRDGKTEPGTRYTSRPHKTTCRPPTPTATNARATPQT